MPGRSRLRQDTQVLKSDLYDDSKPAGPALESGAVHLEDDLNALRSQIKRAIFDDGVGDWFADIPTVNGKKRAIYDLNAGLDFVERKKALRRSVVLTDITVPAGQNWKLLSVGAFEAPPAAAAVTSTTDGAVVAKSLFSGPAFDAHETIVVPGSSAVHVKNLLLIRDAVSGSSIPSAGRTVFGLLQFEGTGADGAAFDDVSGGNRAKISFVRLTAGLDALETCPASDIQGRSINYAYVKRTQFDLLSELDWLDDPAASGGGGGGVTPNLTPLNKGMMALVTGPDGSLATLSPVGATPPANGWISVYVNGVAYKVGNGTKVGVPCYFSGDGGVTARATGAIVAGDFLYWNGSVATFQLDPSDRIDFEYEAL